jgi:hypothetical protein
MGITGAHKALTFWLTNVTLDELLTIATKRSHVEIENDIDRSMKPTLDVDVSWMVRRSAAARKDGLEHTMRVCEQFVKIGFNVVLVCDGSERHHTKRATIKRSVNRYKKQLDMLEKRKKLMSLSEERKNEDSVTKRAKIEKEEEKVSNQLKRLETGFQSKVIDVGDALYEDIKDLIATFDDEMLGANGGGIMVCQAKYQADSVIAHRCYKGISDVVLGNDSDLAAHCGEKCLGIKQFQFNESTKENQLHDIELFASCKSTIIATANMISIDTTGKTTKRIRIPERPVFDGIEDPKVRALIAVGLGCDVISRNIKQVTTNSLHNFISNPHNITEGTMYDSVMKFFVTKHFNVKKKTVLDPGATTKFKCMMNTYVEAFMFEPATYYAGNVDLIAPGKTIYIHDEIPESLHIYVKDFAENNPMINIREDNNPISTCAGPGSGTHCYLCDEECSSCITCMHGICSLCKFEHNKNVYCVNCYVSEKSFPTNDLDVMPIHEMREALIRIGLDVAVGELASEIIDWYDALVVKRNSVYDNEIVEGITMPAENSNFINEVEVLQDFDVKEGGRYIRDDNIQLGHRMELLGLLSDLVSITPNEGTGKSEIKAYSVMPKFLLDYANSARLHSGYRLVKRCVRHAMDPRAVSILHSSGKIVKYEEEVGLCLRHKVKASMKINVYDVMVCFTRTKIVCCSCTCKAGSSGCEKILCVHILPVVYQYSMLLYDGLSEHLLVELANEWNLSLEKSLTNEQKNVLLEYLQELKQSTGVLTTFDKNMKVVDFLKPFSVGTENSKMIPPPPRDPSLLGPLRTLDFNTPIMKAQKKINRGRD